MKRPRPIKRKPVVGKLNAVDLAAIRRIVDQALGRLPPPIARVTVVRR